MELEQERIIHWKMLGSERTRKKKHIGIVSVQNDKHITKKRRYRKTDI